MVTTRASVPDTWRVMGIGRLGQEFNNSTVILFEMLSLTHYGVCGLERGIELEKLIVLFVTI